MTPYFNFTKDGKEYEVHFEDARSIKSKIMLAIEYNLLGLSFWTLMNYFRPTWLLVDYYLDVQKVI